MFACNIIRPKHTVSVAIGTATKFGAKGPSGIVHPELGDALKVPESSHNDLVATDNLWEGDQAFLTVAFLDLGPAESQLGTKILRYMNRWSEYANVGFSLAAAGTVADVRISREVGKGLGSVIGPACLQVPANEATMYLEGFTLQTPDVEFERVVVHEAGHCLGFEHEHVRAEVVEQINPPEAYKYFWKLQGWSKKTTKLNVLTPLEASSVRGAPYVDQHSIMCYHLPASIMKPGCSEVVGGSTLDASDKRYAGELYPLPPDVI